MFPLQIFDLSIKEELLSQFHNKSGVATRSRSSTGKICERFVILPYIERSPLEMLKDYVQDEKNLFQVLVSPLVFCPFACEKKDPDWTDVRSSPDKSVTNLRQRSNKNYVFVSQDLLKVCKPNIPCAKQKPLVCQGCQTMLT